ncbi:uncharacterized protein E5676_scaffold10G00320 [Cucumis melo var. makuwa]|uniref:Uncharacterized protein n=2 Tax=Cucumis melo TaxID=3656 RepID=A0A5D3BCZ2_CUCMM|nr:uncharacterized protein E6C27_scaffold318G001170 [Cucumis melo var. makuwa]TYJ96874.1 uncharacterized protein E5676_scaffold10G00320 [Cucumis melo var. makuwa]
MVEGSISSHLDIGPESKEQVDGLTREDIAWVDSCLIKEIPDISDGNWNHVKDALLEILDLYPQGFESSLALSDNVPGASNGDIDVDMLPSNNVKEPTFSSRDSDDLMNETRTALEDHPMNDTGIASEDPQKHDDIDTSLPLTLIKNPFLPTYKEEVEGNDENDQAGIGHELSEIGSESPINDIFHVWDLNFPPVEDELMEQLNKALTENSVESVPSMDSNLGVLKDLKEDLLDDLINSISDLSLEQTKY